MPIERKLAAIMFTDIAGYTALSAKDSKKTSELLKTQRDTLKPIIEKHGGSWMKEIGDGLLLTFDSATSAVECSIAIQESTKDIEDLNLRIGIHEGEVIKQDDDVIGDDVNVASRIEPFSAVGGVAISHKIQQAISSNQEFETKYIGKPKLKGVSQKVEVYCITSHGLPETDVSKVSAKLEDESKFNIFALTGGILTAIGITFWIAVGVFDVSFGKDEVPSVGILMMDNLGNEDDEFWSSGMTADLIIKVAGAGIIRVAPLKDVIKLDKDLSIEEKAKKLRVKYILTHSFLIKDDGFDLWCKLENIENGVALFSNKISEPMDMTTQMVGKLSNDIITSLKVQTKQDVMQVPTSNSEAYEYYLRGKYKFIKQSNNNDLLISRELLNKAIQLDSNLFIAKDFLSWTYLEEGELEKAKKILDVAIIQAKRSKNKFSYSSLLKNLGNYYLQRLDLEKSLELYQEALLIKKEINDKSGIAKLLNNIALIKRDDVEKRDEVLSYLLQALKIEDEIDDNYTKIKTLLGLSNAYRDRHELKKAFKYINKSISICKNIGDRRSLSSGFSELGTLHAFNGQIDSSRLYYNKSLKIAQEINSINNILSVKVQLGMLLHYEGEFQKSNLLIHEAFEVGNMIEDDINNKRVKTRLLVFLSINYFLMDSTELAVKYSGLSLEYANKYNYIDLMFDPLRISAINYFMKGNYKLALEYLEQSHSIAQEINNNDNIFVVKMLYASYYMMVGDLKKSQNIIEELIELTNPKDREMGRLLNLKARTELFKGNYDISREIMNNSKQILVKYNDLLSIESINCEFGYTYLLQNNYLKALEYFNKNSNYTIKIDELFCLCGFLYSKKMLDHTYELELNTIKDKINKRDFSDYMDNYVFFLLLEDKSYLETAYSQVQELADNLELDVKAKFLGYPIPKAIVEEWGKVK